jgi:hypothetical protein
MDGTRRNLILGTVVAAASIVPFLGGAAAGAAGGPTVTRWVDGTAHPSSIGTSTTGAGYQLSDVTRGLAATVQLHKLSCTATGHNIAEITLEDDGTVGTGSGGMGAQLTFQCGGGVANYTPVLYAGSTTKIAPFHVTSKDQLAATITMDSPLKQTGTLTDVTTNQSITLTATYPAPLTDVTGFVGLGRWPSAPPSPVPNFGLYAWSGVTVNGAALNAEDATGVSLVNASHQTLVETSALAGNGTSFTLTFVKPH